MGDRVKRILKGLLGLSQELVEFFGTTGDSPTETVDDILGERLESEIESARNRLEIERRRQAETQ